MRAHTLVVTCAGDCEREEDELDRCTCSSYGWQYQLICPDQDGSTILVECGVWESCGCRARPYGPIAPDGRLPAVTGSNGVVFGEDDWHSGNWADLIVPVCPITGLPHHEWEGQMFVSSHECFGVQCAENYDKESFEGVACKIFTPGEYLVIWTVDDGVPEWALVTDLDRVAA